MFFDTNNDSSTSARVRPAGWSRLVKSLGVPAPLHHSTFVSDTHISGGRRREPDRMVLDKRYWPGGASVGHLLFALKHEPLDPLVLKRVLDAIDPNDLAAQIRGTPTGAWVRRAWYYYEHFTGSTIDVKDAPPVAAVDLLDIDSYFTATPRLSRRHRVRDNLLGTAAYWPVIRKTGTLLGHVGSDVASHARQTVQDTDRNLVARAANFLVLADSRASFRIEGEHPPPNRVERWARAVLDVGRYPLSVEGIDRLHRTLMDDGRFAKLGLRTEGVFIGDRDPDGDPLPEFIGARPADLSHLLRSLIESHNRMNSSGIDPVLVAAATAFGFVYIHPFQDGNGRIHRSIIQHVLTERGFTPPGLIFPVSAVVLDRINEYRATLQQHSAPLMPFIDWRPTVSRNVEVLNDTSDLYRFFDCTRETEFLYSCVQRTVEHDLPAGIEHLRRRDATLRRVSSIVQLPGHVADKLLLFIRQNNGQLSKRRRTGEFRLLTDDEVRSIEEIVRDEFDLESS